MRRARQIILVTTFLAFSWLAMQAVHESGHVLAALATGGTVQKVVLYPFAFSRTDVTPNPHPLVEVWAGPLLGSLLPLLGWALAVRWRVPYDFLWRFFAGFCLVANGVYLLCGSFAAETDPGDLMRLGMPQGVLISVGLVGTACGLWLWHRQGRYFGIGALRDDVKTGPVVLSVLLLAMIAIGELIYDSR